MTSALPLPFKVDHASPLFARCLCHSSYDSEHGSFQSGRDSPSWDTLHFELTTEGVLEQWHD